MLSHTVSGTEVRRRRELAGLSPAALAAKAGISRTFVYKIERGEKQPSADVAGRIATALDATVADLVAKDGDRDGQHLVETA